MLQEVTTHKNYLLDATYGLDTKCSCLWRNRTARRTLHYTIYILSTLILIDILYFGGGKSVLIVILS